MSFVQRVILYLDSLFLESESVDESQFPGLLGEIPDAVLVLLPPGSAKVIGPVRSRTGRRHVDEPAHWSVGNSAPSDWVNMGL